MGSGSPASTPFFNRGPIRDPHYFYGRSAETEAVLGLLSQMQNCSVAGPIKIGKTSFLYHLTRPEVWQAHGLDPSQHALAYLSFEELGTESAEAIFGRLAREAVGAAIAQPFADGPPTLRGELSLSELRDTVARLTRDGGRVIWLLDEFELTAENPHLDLHFFSALRSLISDLAVAVVTASCDPLHEMPLGERRVGSPLADLFTVVRLGSLTEEEALSMVRDLSSRGGGGLESVWPHIKDLAGSHPFLLQVLCDLIMRSDRDPEDENWDEVATEFYELAEPFLHLRWMRLRPEERAVLARLGEGHAWPEDLPLLRRLARVAWVKREDDRWQPACRVITDFLVGQATATEAEEVLGAASALREPPTDYRAGGDDAIRRVVRALARAAEAHHSAAERDRAPWYAMMIARGMGCDESTVEEIRMAARLRDIGHVATPDLIFHKPGPLTEEEWTIVRAHPAVGAQILDALELPPQVRPAVRWHHERRDGSGYPDGLLNDEIPLAASIVGAAEAYSAITSDRPYRPAMSPRQALETIKASATLYHQGVAAALERVVTTQHRSGEGAAE